jgi:hypothetical protein
MIMAKQLIDKEQLEALLLRLLRETPKCDGAESVHVDLNDEDPASGNWAVTHFHPGASTRDDCEDALWDLQAKLLPDYEISR